MAVNLLDFLYDTNNDFANKVESLIKGWRVGISCCTSETELLIYNMYARLLSTDLTDYNITSSEIIGIMNNIINIFNINNVVVNEGDTITYVTNTVTNVVYNTTIINEVPSYSGTYSGIGEFVVNVNHALNKLNPTVIVTDTSTGNRFRVEVGITEINADNIVLSFSSTSSGDYKIM